MNAKVELYIKKLIALGLIFFGANFAAMYAPAQVVIPIALFVLSFIYAGITNKKPPYLFQLQKVEAFLNKKGGFWNLFKIILIFIGLIYDIIIWEIYSIYIIFEIIIDIILFIKEIIFWIIHAIIWFLKLMVPPIVFVYRMFLHYVVRWIWWIYQFCFKNVTPSVKLNYFLISLWGAILAIFSVLLFYYFSVLFDVEGLIFIGIVLSLLPLAWSYGEISSINENNLQDEPFYEVTSNFENGFESVKYVLYYVVAFFGLFLIQIIFDFLGWIPSVGLTFLGIVINLSTLISLVMLFLLIIVLFANAIIPTHLLKTEQQETPFHDIILLFKTILRKGLRYILSLIPASFFSGILMIIPAIIVVLAIAFTLKVKDNVIEHHINNLQETKSIVKTKMEAYTIDKKIEKMNYYIDFPFNIIDESIARKDIDGIIMNKEFEIEDLKAGLTKTALDFDAEANHIRKQINEAKQIEDSKTRESKIKVLNLNLNQAKTEHDKVIAEIQLQIQKKVLDIKYLKSKKRNLPVTFFLLIIWAAAFGGLVLAFGVSYYGNVYYHMYPLKEDDKPTFYRDLVNDINKKDSRQPLLGFTVLAVIIIILSVIL